MTNKPEVVAWSWDYRGLLMLTTVYSRALELTEPPYPTEVEPLIRLADYEALQAECEKLRKDAARYQWLKHLAIKGSYDRDWEFPLVDAWEYRPGSEANVEHETLDAAIDAAMQENEP